MYKIIHNNVIVDVVKELRYVRYIPEIKKVVPTSASTAQAICGSDNRTFYALMGVKTPSEKSHWKKVTYIKITPNEYESLKESLCKDCTIYANEKELGLVRSRKISEMSDSCKQAITNGTSIVFNDGTSRHFRFTLEDQINLLEIEREVQNGASVVLYHSTNSVCEVFNRTDVERLLHTYHRHKSYHTTYFNLLKYCINNMSNIDEITSIKYGVDLLTLGISDYIKKTIKERLNG